MHVALYYSGYRHIVAKPKLRTIKERLVPLRFPYILPTGIQIFPIVIPFLTLPYYRLITRTAFLNLRGTPDGFRRLMCKKSDVTIMTMFTNFYDTMLMY